MLKANTRVRGRVKARPLGRCLIAGVSACLWLVALAGCGPAKTAPGPATPPLPSAVAPTSTATLALPSATRPASPSATDPATPSPIPQTEISEATSPSEQSSIDGTLAQLEELPVEEFIEQSYRQLQLRDPDALIINGLAAEYGVPNNRFSDMSDGFLRETQELESAILGLLRSYDRSALSPSQQLSYDAYEWLLDDRIRAHEFKYHDYPVNPLTVWGKQNWLIDFMARYQPIADKQDAKDYVTRLAAIDTWVGQLLAGLRRREQAGIIPPVYIIEPAIDQIDGHLHMVRPGVFDVKAIELYVSFRNRLDQTKDISAQDKQILLDAALTEVEQTFVPAYVELKSYLLRLRTRAGEEPGAGVLPGGPAYYAHVLRTQTGTGLSPERIHEMGLAEVARLQSEIGEAAIDLGYPEGISVAGLEARLADQVDYLQGYELLAEYEDLIASAERAAESFFELLPAADLAIQPEPFGSGIGYYQPPPLNGSGPGVFYTNLNMPIARHIIPTFIFHETVPGHHVQGALARELEAPTFRRALELNGYLEGWAVYAERLAWEMGLYEDDPLGNLGRLQFELSRAARLVVDTGIHARGWSREEAAAYYERATGRPTSPGAMDRYVILPGQGCGYTVGLLKILEMRQRAMDKLGAGFKIEEFHSVILGNGPLPFEILESVVDDWIEASLDE